MRDRDATAWTTELIASDEHRCDGVDSWWRAMWETHRQFAGRFTTGGQRHADGAVTMNLQYAATKTLHAGILPKRLRGRCKAIIPSEEPNAYRASVLLNWNWHRDRIRRTFDTVELNGQTKGVGLTYTTWGGPFSPTLLEGEATPLQAEVPKGKRGTGHSDAVAAELRRVFPHRLADQSLVRTYAIDPIHFFTDPERIVLEQARWAAHRYYLWESEAESFRQQGFYTCAQSDLRFDMLLPSARNLNGGADEAKPTPGESPRGQRERRWEAFMVHDFQHNQIFHVIPGMEVFARAPQPAPAWFRPYHAYTPNATGDDFWAKPDAWMYFPAQRMLNRVMHAMAAYADFMGKGLFFYPPGFEDWAEKVADADPGEGIAVPPEVANLWRSLGHVSASLGTIPEALRDLKPELERIIMQMSAISEAGQGSVVKGVTATASAISQQSQSVRSGYNRALLLEHAGDVAEVTTQLLQNLLDQEQVIPILGVEQAAEWGIEPNQAERHLAITPGQIQGHFDYECLAGDNADQIRVEEKNMALQAANLLSTFIGPGLVDPKVLLPWLADKFEIPPEVVRATPVPMPGPEAGQPVNREPTQGPSNPAQPVGDLGSRQRTNPTAASELSQGAGANNRPAA